MMWRNSVLRFQRDGAKIRAIAVITGFALVATALIISSLAATPTADLNPEAGSRSAKVSIVSDASASGGQAVKFGSATSVSSGIWMSQSEVMALPASGAAWDRVRTAAYGNLGTVDLGDLNATHDVNVLAAALVAVRLNDTTLRNKVVTELGTLDNSGYSRVLELSRNIQAYVFAADIINLKTVNPTADAEFRSFLQTVITKPLQGHSVPGGEQGSIRQTARDSSNNWGNHARAAAAAIGLYLNDTALINDVTMYYKGWIGDRAAYSGLTFSDTTWHYDANNKRGINQQGATRSGYNMDGIQPEDLRRGSTDFSTNPAATGYVWEGLQGATVAGIILDRAGKVPLSSQNNALLRAYNWAYNTYNTPAEGDDTWMPWLANKLFGGNFPTEPAGLGKNMSWTDWTHAP